MGISLCPIGNHKIEFKDKTYEVLANEIKEKLDGIVFENAAFLKEVALKENSHNPDSISRIMVKNQWTFFPEDEYYNFAEDKFLTFDGPFELHLWMDAYTLMFFSPSSRYWEWLEMTDEDRFEWRKYYYKVLQALGGDRVIYLADNSHPLDSFNYLEVPLDAVEQKLVEAFGEPKKTLEEVAKNYEKAFFVDRFEDLKMKGTE